ncbi:MULTISPECIES: tight junction protein ZO-3 [Bifidobacterium]|jgi:hypothetical protein|uniref:tight junction protein ZO-3 n=1 Tax=Bifidobacterium TaxID=1678 RepID=UPI00103EF4F6|nr:tight junction protein ZO-3 [Bifidobacterium longum]TCF21545.1 hypothetical protein MCC10091_1252 [Bifidobacterium longum subsp. longum]
MRKPFADWDLENFFYRVLLGCMALFLVFALGILCFVCWSYAQTLLQPEQTIIQQVETTGDVKRLCIEAKTDGRIDAMSCDVIDPMSGGVK